MVWPTFFSFKITRKTTQISYVLKAIFPSPDPAAIHDQRIRDLITYARKVEKDMFEQAPDKEAYYHMLAEKIYKIQKELQEKKNRRLNEQQNQQLGGGQLQQQTDLQQHHQALIHQQSVHIREIKQEPKGEQQPQGNQPMLNFVDQIPNKRPKIEEPGKGKFNFYFISYSGKCCGIRLD